MTQVKTGIRTILEHPIVYSSLQNILGTTHSYRVLVDKYLQVENGMKILDIGCGPADVRGFIKKDVTYVGFDFEQSYVEKARTRYPGSTFHCEDVSKFHFPPEEKFDRILISALLHHLDDDGASHVLSSASKLISEKGFVLCVEPVRLNPQNFIARKLIDMDRGQNVRGPEGYKQICERNFKSVKVDITHDLLRIPYDHIFLTCSN